jgi:hypothetical protein
MALHRYDSTSGVFRKTGRNGGFLTRFVLLSCVTSAAIVFGSVRHGLAQRSTMNEPHKSDKPTPGVPQAPAEPSPDVIPLAATGLAVAPQELVAAVDESVLPHTVTGLLEELDKRADTVRQLVASSSLGSVWVAAMATKTVALVLESQAMTLPEGPRAMAITASKRVVTAAWQLDAFGELGDKTRVDEAFARLSSGVSDLKAAYAQH